MTRLISLLSTAALTFGLTQALSANDTIKNVATNCSCGFRDPDTNQLWTDSIIVYFNETIIDGEIWRLPQYEHIKEQGWNAIYRAGADGSLANVYDPEYDQLVGHNVNALELRLNASTDQHLVMGANLATLRRDIQYGSFESGMKPPARQSAGTALSMLMRYNSSEGFNVDFMNMDDPTDACITNLINGEWPSNDTITNFTTIASDKSGHNPFNTFTSARVLWNQTTMGFWLNGNQTRFVTEADRSVPTAGQALELLTWSTGDDTYMEGPPLNRYTSSHVLYVRAFFNSSVWTDADHLAYDQTCFNSDKQCKTSDITLRNATLINSDASLLMWEDLPEDDRIHKMAGIVASIFSAFGVVALINAFFRRIPWSKLSAKSRKAKNDKTLRRAVRQSFHAGDADHSSTNSDSIPDVPRFSDGFRTSGIATPLPVYGDRSGTQTPAPAYEANGRGEMLSRTASISSYRQMAPSPTNDGINSNRNSDEKDIKGLDIIDETPWAEARARASGIYYKPDEKIAFDEPEVIASTSPAMTVSEKGKRASVTVQPFVGEKDQPTEEVVTAESLPAVVQHAPKPAGPTKRIDYLAGLVAVACIGVTLHHWCQTFWPYITEGYGNTQHYPGAEEWIGIFIGSFALTQLWIGPFFLTATRFLSTNYLKNGNLEDIAKKMLRRAPRLFIPIIITSLLQFFLLSLDLQHFLLWSPSITWSDWPYVVPQGNFAQWMNNMVELGYLYPGAVPEIVPHYCIGVLWTVPVQLQMTYVVLVAAVLIRNVKTPWKRFAFYAAFIVTGWYARSWAACHWCGLVLSDLEATYKWRAYLKTRPWKYYAVIAVAFIGAAGTPLVSVFNQTWSFPTVENSMHPDIESGKTISQIDPLYPDYFEPTLTIITFSIGLQILVELSTWVQAFLSTPVVLWLHPHIMTIYLTHGFVMWTWGAFITVKMNDAGAPYWANLLVNLVTTYMMIFLLASVLTPLMEVPTQGALRIMDRWTMKEPMKKRPMTAPFSKALIMDRQEDDTEETREV